MKSLPLLLVLLLGGCAVPGPDPGFVGWLPTHTTVVAHRGGANVTILEALPTVLPRVDQDAVNAIRAESERIGVTIKTGVNVSKIERARGRLRVHYDHDGTHHTLDVDRAVNGAGRVANVDALDLDAGDIKHDGVRIEIDEYLRSVSNPAVWVCGDALVDSAQLSPLATYEGRVVGENIVNGPTIKPDYSVIASCVYTVPAVSTVGMTEVEAKDRGRSVKISVQDMTGWFSGKSYAESTAWAKTLVDEETDQIVGAHMVGHQGEDLIHIFALAMANGITASRIKDTLFAFPTFSSDIKNLL